MISLGDSSQMMNLVLTNESKYGRKDSMEITIGKVAKGTHTSWLLRGHQRIGTCAILLERRRGRVEVAAAVELERVSQSSPLVNLERYCIPAVEVSSALRMTLRPNMSEDEI